MKECSKSIARRMRDPLFMTRYFRGDGIDIGGKPDPLMLYCEFFCRIGSVRTWDWEDGDAQFMQSVSDESFDFVHSSHCLEHLNNPFEGLVNWFRILRPGGHLIVTVPDEDLYEQGVFPSTFNRDHKNTFSIHKATSWSTRHVNVIDLLLHLGDRADIQKIELLIATFRDSLPRYDQTLTPIGESGIEFVVRKRMDQELTEKGRLPSASQPSTAERVHYNQYRDDFARMKTEAATHLPFQNEQEL